MEPLNPNYQDTDTKFLISNSNGKHNHHHHIHRAIEMLTIQPASYTSLRDIIALHSSAPARDTPPPTAPASPSKTTTTTNCWDDVPIKNQLLKQAALAYLQPMSTPPEIDHASWIQRMTAGFIRCFGGDGEDDGGKEVGCMSALDGVVLAPIKDLLVRILKVFSRKGEEDHED